MRPTFATKKLSTCPNGQKEDTAFQPFGPRSFDRAVIEAQWYDLGLETRETWVRTAALGKQRSSDHPIDVPASSTHPDAYLRYEEALNWRRWTKGGYSSPLVRTVLIELP